MENFDFWPMFWAFNGLVYVASIIMSARRMYQCKKALDWIDYILIFTPIVNVYVGFK